MISHATIGVWRPTGSEWPVLAVFAKQGSGHQAVLVRRTQRDTADPGQDPRGAPDPTPLWNILDLTPGGRGTDWYPKLDY